MANPICSLAEYPDENKAVLKLHVDFVALDRVEEFRTECLRLLQTGMGQLVIDLSILGRIPSGVLSAVMDAGLLAGTGEGPEQRVVVLAGPAVARQFRCFEHSSALDIRQWDASEAQDAEAGARGGGRRLRKG
jgi:hypothetical protein